MDKEDSGQHPRGFANTLIGGINNGATTVRGMRLARAGGAAVGAVGSLGPIAIGVIVGVFILVFLLVLTQGTGFAGGLPGEEQAAVPTIAPPGGGGGPIAISGTGETCVVPFAGTGYCSIDNLQKYFGGNRNAAIVASLICHSESGSWPLALNDTCATNDYSIGLFQINAVAHCVGAYSNLSCSNLISPTRRSACLSSWQDPEQNVQQALRISSIGTNWEQWGTWLNPGKTRIGIRHLLTQCGVSL